MDSVSYRYHPPQIRQGKQPPDHMPNSQVKSRIITIAIGIPDEAIIIIKEDIPCYDEPISSWQRRSGREKN